MIADGAAYVDGVLTSRALVANQAQAAFIERASLDLSAQDERGQGERGQDERGQDERGQGGRGRDLTIEPFTCKCVRRSCYDSVLAADTAAGKTPGYHFRLAREHMARVEPNEDRRAVRNYVRNVLLPKPNGHHVCDLALSHITGRSNSWFYPLTQAGRVKRNRKLRIQRARAALPGVVQQARRVSEMAQTVVVHVIAWFVSLLPVLDRMPDQDYYLVPAVDRKEVFGWYEAARQEAPDLFKKTVYQNFLRIWKKHCPTIRLRKYMRFSKCLTCTDLKLRKQSMRGRGNAVPRSLLDLMTKHYKFITLCRADATHKANLAIDQPGQFISIAQDGTDQLGYGVPKGAESTHKEDNLRLKSKVMIDVVHGSGVYMYLMPDDVANGPDESIECLQRTLKKEESKRGGTLPPTLFLQFDNCFRENKNTYMVAYLAWLVERGVFKRIFLSFHPVGHTHNECDQCASRISIATARAEIACNCDFVKILEGCYTPRPHVEKLENVVSWKLELNPEGALKNRYPKSSLVRPATNISKSHHFLFYQDWNGVPVFRDKLSVDQQDWSEHMTTFKSGRCGLRPEDLKQKPTRPPAPKELDTIRQTLDHANFRLNAVQKACLHKDLTSISSIRNANEPIHWLVSRSLVLFLLCLLVFVCSLFVFVFFWFVCVCFFLWFCWIALFFF